MNELSKDKVESLLDCIMKNCLWQFHSRSWDRRRQNEEILKKTSQLLCEEELDLSTPFDRCYWVDAVWLAETYRKDFPWITTMPKDEIKALIKALHERLDFVTIDGSLNEELTDQKY